MIATKNEAVRSVSVGDVIFATVLSCGRTVFRATKHRAVKSPSLRSIAQRNC